MDREQRKEVSVAIINQLGGRKFMMMTGVKTFVTGETGGVSFKIGRNVSKCNQVSIEYDCGRDLYNVVFKRERRTKNKELSIKGFPIWDYKTEELERTNGCYFDMLVPLFEEYTGLATRLF